MTAPEQREMPKRIQQRRSSGWRMPANARSVARPSKYGNSFVVEQLPWDRQLGRQWRVTDVAGIAEGVDEPNVFATQLEARAFAVDLYELHTGPMGSYELDMDEVIRDLKGKDLACWCPLPKPGEIDWCHAAVLLRISNGGDDAAGG